MSIVRFPANARVCVSATKMTRSLLAALALLLMIAVPALPQANQGTIQGTVYDQSGGAIAGATVTIVDIARGVSRPLTTDSAGAYLASNLIPGTYTVRGVASGFQTLEHSNILIEVGQTIRVDLVLQPGAQTQTVTVTSEAAAIDTTDVTLGGTMSNQQVNELPMNGRDFKTFLNLRPAVAAVEGGGIDSWSANGSRGEDIGYLVDGLRVDESYTGNSAINSPVPSGDNATDLPFDAIQEMDTEANSKAEFGWKPGAIINVGLKSGTNDLHGTAFAFGRDTALDARNFFNSAALYPKAPITFEQFGGSAGGRIKKDKLFWFADYEGQQYTVAGTIPTSTPATSLLPGGNTTANIGSSLVNACLALGASKISALSAQIAGLNPSTCAIAPQSYTPGPTESMFPVNTGTGAIFLSLLSSSYSHNGIGKIDYHVNDHNTINGEYFYGVGQGNFSGSGGTAGIPGSSNSPFMSEYGPTKVQFVVGAWNWVPSSTKVNEFRVGYDHFYQPYYSLDYNVNPLAYGFNSGVTDPKIFGFPTISFSSFGIAFGGGQHKVIGPDGAFQMLDHYSIVHGNHSFKIGGEFIDNSANAYQNATGKGSISFASLTTFLEGIPNTTGSKINVGNPQRSLTNYLYALFAQDDWRATRRLTVNLGLRWEYSSVLKESNDQLGNFTPAVGLEQVGKNISSPYFGDFRDYGPRVGVAWDVFGTGRTVVRAGGSVMYSYLPIISFIAADQVLGISQVPTGATIVTQATGAAGTPGLGNITFVTVPVTGPSLQTGWQAQTPACIAAAETGGASTCGTVFPSSVFQIKCGDGLGSDPQPCISAAVAQNLRNAYISTWTFGIQQALTNNLTLDVAYVGTHGSQLPGYLDINQAALGSGFTAPQKAAGIPTAVSSASEQLTRPYYSQFPYLSYIDELENFERSNYSGLQATVTQRVWHSWTFLAGYTYSHALDDASSNTFNSLPPDSTNPGLQYGNSDFDMTHRFTLSSTYILPGKKSPGQLLEGWQVNAISILQTGMPWTADDQTYDLTGNGEVNNLDPYGNFWDFSGNRSDFSHPVPTPFSCWSGTSSAALKGCSLNSVSPQAPTQCTNAASAISANTLAAMNAVGCYIVNNSVMFPSALGTIGNAGRNIFRSSHFRNLDFSVDKNWKFRERLTAQFRAEFFNVLNHPNFYTEQGVQGTHAGSQFNFPAKGATGEFGCSCITPDQGAGNLVLGAGGARAIQLGLKLIF